MEINKQLFEDVLSGKLKGTFVLRNGFMCSDTQLDRNHNWHAEICPYRLRCRIYKPNGMFGFNDKDSWNIIDFIPDTDMKETKLTVEIPDGKIVDWDESKKQNKIVLKNKQLTYEDICDELYGNKINIVYFIDTQGDICKIRSSELDEEDYYGSNNATSRHQLECILAKNKLATVAKYLNNGWKPNKGDCVFVLSIKGDFKNSLSVIEYYFGDYYGAGEYLVLFKTQNVAQQAIEILGEETVKLALEPLGI